MSALFRKNIAKYYFYKYDQIGTTIPKILSVFFDKKNQTVDILTKEESPRYLNGIIVVKTSKDTCLYTFPSDGNGALSPIKNMVSFK